MSSFKASRYRVPLSFVLGIGILLLAVPTKLSMLAGLLPVILGEGLRTWSSGYIRKNRELAIHGPYGYTRNPLYLGNFLIGLGFSIMVSRPLLFFVFIIAFFGIYRSLILEEEARLSERFGEAFLSYKDRVPRMFPQFGSPVPSGQFDWRLVLKHEEHYTWLGSIAGIAWLLWNV